MPRKLKTPTKLSPVWVLFRNAVVILNRQRRLFLGLLAVYVITSLILVHGLTRTVDLTGTKNTLSSSNASTLSSGTELMSALFINGTSSSAATTYQLVLFIVMSLAVIWALRHAYAEPTSTELRAKMAMYRGMTPLIPFVLVLLLIGLQLVPFMVGASVYTVVVSRGIASGVVERLLWTAGLFALTLWSMYMLASSIFALYIVTLPDMTPRKALKSAKQLIKNRRATIIRKLLFLPLAIILLITVIMLPTVLLLTPIAEWIFFVLGLALIIVAHSYIYALYRELT